MKIRKKLLAGFVAAVMIVGSTIPALAAGSATRNVTVVGDSAGQYTVSANITSTPEFQQLQQSAPEVASVITEVNSGSLDVAAVTTRLQEMLANITDETAKASLEKVIAEISETEFATGFVELTATSAAEKNASGKYEVTLSVPALTDSVTTVKFLHYSTARNLWEIIEAKSFDKTAKTATGEFEDLSPVAVLVNAGAASSSTSTGSTTSSGTSTSGGSTTASAQTGDEANMMLWIVAIVAAVAIGGAVVYRKKTA